MEVYYYKDKKMNFGDDLNEHIWKAILPKDVWGSDDIVLVGIGSILNERHLGRFSGSKKRVVVLGTGTSYGPPPKDMTGWAILAVRGPLTAAVVDLPDRAITDGAILLAAIPELNAVNSSRGKIVFMPHHRSLEGSRWEAVCEQAGIEYVSPATSVTSVMAKFADAKIVLAEAMHAAIVADTLRIPWVPVSTSPRIDEFKWNDWTMSMELPFEPFQVSPSSASNHRNYRRLGSLGQMAGDPRRYPELLADGPALRADLAARYENASDWVKRPKSRVEKLGLRIRKKIAKISDPIVARTIDASFIDKASAQLQRAATSRAFLSEDRIFSDLLERMLTATSGLSRLV